MDDSIIVKFKGNTAGKYPLLTSPYCQICASPNITTQKCGESPFGHSDLYGFKRLYAVGSYITKRSKKQEKDLLSNHILVLKGSSDHAIPLGFAMCICFENRFPELKTSDMLVPVPQHPDKILKRGYNQALQLARVVERHSGIPVVEALEKTRNDRSTNKSRADIKEMVKGLYRCLGNKFAEVKGKSIIVIDDTATTCFDIAECADQLRQAGAKEVNAFVVGRTAWS